MHYQSIVNFRKISFDYNEILWILKNHIDDLEDFDLIDNIELDNTKEGMIETSGHVLEFQENANFQKLLKETFPFSAQYYDSYSDSVAMDNYYGDYHVHQYGLLSKTLCDPSDAVIVQRKPLILGEFSKKFDPEEILISSSGTFHEVKVLKDGSIVTRGSNANKQLSMPSHLSDINDLQCGDSFTAILSKGKVSIYGGIEFKENNWPYEMEVKLVKDFKYVPEDVSNDMFVGDKVSIKFKGRRIEVYHRGKLLGNITQNFIKRQELFENIFLYNTPIIKQIPDYVDVKIERQNIEFIVEFINSKDLILDSYNVKVQDVNTWPQIERIFVVENAILGVTSTGDYLFDGSVNNILLLSELLKGKVAEDV